MSNTRDLIPTLIAIEALADKAIRKRKFSDSKGLCSCSQAEDYKEFLKKIRKLAKEPLDREMAP